MSFVNIYYIIKLTIFKYYFIVVIIELFLYNQCMYIIEFNEIEKEAIWGGSKLANIYNKPFDRNKKIGESWELSGIENSVSVVKNGKYKGININELIAKNKIEVLGEKNKDSNDFPLLLKIIDSNDKLSIQVHPDEEYAQKHHNKHGKNELWYIVDCDEDAKLLIGLKKDITIDSLKSAIKNNKNIEEMFNIVSVKPHDVFYIKAGTVHAILAGSIIAEIQTPCDLTYRLYDWNRVDKNGMSRELHIDHSFNTIKNVCIDETKINKVYEDKEHYKKANIANNEFFYIDEILLKENEVYSSSTSKSNFNIIMFLEGKGYIESNANDNRIEIKNLKTVFLPASLGEFRIKAHSDLTFLSIKN